MLEVPRLFLGAGRGFVKELKRVHGATTLNPGDTYWVSEDGRVSSTLVPTLTASGNEVEWHVINVYDAGDEELSVEEIAELQERLCRFVPERVRRRVNVTSVTTLVRVGKIKGVRKLYGPRRRAGRYVFNCVFTSRFSVRECVAKMVEVIKRYFERRIAAIEEKLEALGIEAFGLFGESLAHMKILIERLSGYLKGVRQSGNEAGNAKDAAGVAAASSLVPPDAPSDVAERVAALAAARPLEGRDTIRCFVRWNTARSSSQG